MQEKTMIADAQRGDLDAFNRLVLAYQDMLYGQAYRLMGEKYAAEDATQEAFISAFRKIKSFRGGSFKAWLLRIVTNACYDELRRRKRRPTTQLEPVNEENEPIESPNWLTDPRESPEIAAQRSEIRAALELCIQNLPIEFRTVVLLVDIQGLDYTEAARVIRRPLGTVKSRLARARVRMRDCLSNYGELLPTSFRLLEESE